MLFSIGACALASVLAAPAAAQTVAAVEPGEDLSNLSIEQLAQIHVRSAS